MKKKKMIKVQTDNFDGTLCRPFAGRMDRAGAFDS